MNAPCRSVLVATLVCVGTASASAEPRAVVELFTSQGCSSCPPADKLMGELAQDKTLLVLSLPIDYWDYLGWKDTLAKPAHTARQRAYAVRRGDREVYTPQVVINGVAHALGNDRQAIEGAIARSSTMAPLALPVRLAVDGERVEVAIPGAEGTGPGLVWLCSIAKTVPVPIARGENGGRTVTYSNVVRRWVKLGKWSGEAQTWTLPKGEFTDGVDALAVLVQAGSADSPGAMLGAATLALH